MKTSNGDAKQFFSLERYIQWQAWHNLMTASKTVGGTKIETVHQISDTL